MFYQESLLDIPNVTSLPESAFGRTRSEKPDGLTDGLFGLAPARANLSARQAKAQGLLTSGTCGQRFTGSSASVDLMLFFGEQVESADGRDWLDLVQSDLEASAYAVGSVGLCAAGFGAPHIRHRIFFVADAASDNQQRIRQSREGDGWRELSAGRHGAVSGLGDALPAGRAKGWSESGSGQVAGGGEFNYLANADSSGRARSGSAQSKEWRGDFILAGRGESGGLGDASGTGLQVRESGELQGEGRGTERRAVAQPGATNGFWSGAEWLYCRDGKYRAVEPGTFPLAHGAAERVGRLRGYGDAIVAPVAEEFIRAYLETGRGEK